MTLNMYGSPPLRKFAVSVNTSRIRPLRVTSQPGESEPMPLPIISIQRMSGPPCRSHIRRKGSPVPVM